MTMPSNDRKRWAILLLFLFLAACGQQEDAPVVESKWHAMNPSQASYRVIRGDTLYSIAFHYDKDYRALAQLNHLQTPYKLRVGQVLHLRPYKIKVMKPSPRTVRPKAYLPMRQPKKIISSRQNNWVWPLHGRVVATFLPQQGKKGIDIAGKKEDKIHAAAAGVVAYAGNGIAGYGNLIIIKHNNGYLTAYGNNLRNLVREGQQIKAGQIIAEIGKVDRRFWGVHFEIRKAGQPVNPLNYL